MHNYGIAKNIKNSSQFKLLFLDDSAFVREWFIQELAPIALSCGVELQVVENLQGAVNQLQEHIFDGVVVDYILEERLSGIQAIEFLQQFKKNDLKIESKVEVKFALMSGGDLSAKQQQEAQMKGIYFFKKPSPEQLAVFIEDLKKWLQS